MASNATVPIHLTPNAVTYYATGNQTPNTDGTPFTAANTMSGVVYLAGIDISNPAPADGTIAVFGDQYATASPPGTTATWAADLPSALSAQGIPPPGGVVNTSTSGTAPSHWWQLNGPGLDTSTTAYDSGSSASANLTLKNGAAWTTSDPGTGTSQGALSLGGNTAYTTTSTSAVNTAGSFTVSAWVNMAPTMNAPTQTAVAESGSQSSGFYLGYNASQQAWGFYFAGSDSASPTFNGAYSFRGGAISGEWELLTGTYDASTNTARLYVNGTNVSTVTVGNTWAAGGNLTVGADLSAGVISDQFGGEISDVQTFGTALSASQVASLAADTGQSTMTTSNAVTAYRNYVAAEPNLRDVIINLGANDVLKGVTTATIRTT